MKLTLIADDKTLVQVQCDGEIGDEEYVGDAEPMSALLAPLGGFRRKVLLNLERATIIYTSGMSWLLKCNKHFIQDGGVIVIHSVPPMVEQAIKLVRLDRILHFASDAASARTVALGEAK